MAQEKKKRWFGKEHLNDFKRDASGEYAYQGSHMEYARDEEQWKKEIRYIWIACVVPAILLLLIGFIPHSGLDGNLLVILPYAAEVIALFIQIWKVVRLSYGGPKLRKYVHHSTADFLPGIAVVVMITAAFALAGIIVSMILKTFNGGTFAMILYFAAQICLGIGGWVIFQLMKKMVWNELW